ncbi:hypothetical protein DFH94DRAFT_692006 [Russula ochroleuca]|uniref:Uncharacterized protein n=1 Tax=Russula ochroleuca TaxID=152965 RepID=A0A9P5MX87_9AGAM|nr:hypothetical protein DFH94DRAFT_692006 [Russula ochroleuca]
MPPDNSLIPLVDDNNNPALDSPKKRYQISRLAVILSAVFFIVLILLAIFIALFTSFVQAQESAAAATTSETPS